MLRLSMAWIRWVMRALRRTFNILFRTCFSSAWQNNHVLTTVDITNVLDEVFVIAIDQYPCPFCKGLLIYHKFRECPALVTLMEESTAYYKVTMDPKWNPDAQDKPATSPPPRTRIL